MTMQYTINELKHTIFKEVFDVYEIFQNFFGEDYTDLQGIPEDEENEIIQAIFNSSDISNINSNTPFELSSETLEKIKVRYNAYYYYILVWWPTVRVTNENNKSVIIKDLYAKITINIQGKIAYEYTGFQLTRTTFTDVQFKCGYLHSHIPRFYRRVNWDNPCLGTGPIRNTILELKNNNSEITWMLFCQELSLYVTVESLQGGPYFRMEEIGNSNKMSEYKNFSTVDKLGWYPYIGTIGSGLSTFINAFIPYYLKHGHLRFCYRNSMYQCGMTCFAYMMDISNTFIKWINEEKKFPNLEFLYSDNILRKAKVIQGEFYENTSAVEDFSEYEGTMIITFKGALKTLHIEATSSNREEETVTIMDYKIAMCILTKILRTINYRFHNGNRNKDIRDSEEGITSTHKAVLYI